MMSCFRIGLVFIVVTAAAPVWAIPGIWISQDEIAALPMSGGAWDRVLSKASLPACSPVLEDQNDTCNIVTMAKALVFARTGDTVYYDEVAAALAGIANSGPYGGRALALARRLGAYVIAADIVDLQNRDPALHAAFSQKIAELRDTPTIDGPFSLVDSHERRLNDWGTSAGFARVCIDLYLNDQVDLARAVQVWKGWMGDRQSYAGFEYESMDWQADPANPRGVNAVGATIDGWNVDGVLPDDQRLAGPFAPPPFPCINDVPGSFQGALSAAIVLERKLFVARLWQTKALKRAVIWYTQVAGCQLEGDDEFEAILFNYLYPELNLPVRSDLQPGKLVGFADWTHGPWSTTDATAGVEPDRSSWLTAAPSPFEESVAIRMDLARRGEVRLRIVDVRGREVRVLHEGVLPAGSHRLRWDGRDGHGHEVAAGVYFVAGIAGDRHETRKVVRAR